MRTSKGILVLGLMAVIGAGCAQQTTKATSPGLKKIHFDFDQSYIKAEYEPVLKGNASFLKSNARTNIAVEGHCDERGTNEYNIALGDRRAQAAKRYLVNLGISDGRLSIVSYGEEKSVCSEHDESCWWQNRRAEFLKK